MYRLTFNNISKKNNAPYLPRQLNTSIGHLYYQSMYHPHRASLLLTSSCVLKGETLDNVLLLDPFRVKMKSHNTAQELIRYVFVDAGGEEPDPLMDELDAIGQEDATHHQKKKKKKKKSMVPLDADDQLMAQLESLGTTDQTQKEKKKKKKKKKAAMEDEFGGEFVAGGEVDDLDDLGF